MWMAEVGGVHTTTLAVKLRAAPEPASTKYLQCLRLDLRLVYQNGLLQQSWSDRRDEGCLRHRVTINVAVCASLGTETNSLSQSTAVRRHVPSPLRTSCSIFEALQGTDSDDEGAKNGTRRTQENGKALEHSALLSATGSYMGVVLH